MTRTNDTPKVSVVIPAYNAAICLSRAIDSVLKQTYSDFELIVVDDGSTDTTADVALGYGHKLHLLRQPNRGLPAARNAGIHTARGTYVAFLDADDWWLPDKLERQVTLMETHPKLAFCSTAAEVHSPEGELLRHWCCGEVQHTLLETIFQHHAFVAGSGSAVMARRQVLLQAGGFDEQLASLEDIDLWMRLAAIGGYACIDTPLTVIEKRPGSLSGNLELMRACAIRVMKKNRHLLPPEKRGKFWRAAYAAMLADYAKWAYRQGKTAQALLDLLHGLALAPIVHGRLLGSLLVAMVLRQSL